MEIIPVILATWRVTNMIWAEAGPLDMFERFRRFMKRRPVTGALVSCELCLSVWVAFGMLLVPKKIVKALAWSGGTCLIFILLELGWKAVGSEEEGEDKMVNFGMIGQEHVEGFKTLRGDKRVHYAARLAGRWTFRDEAGHVIPLGDVEGLSAEQKKILIAAFERVAAEMESGDAEPGTTQDPVEEPQVQAS